jgi:hypothetical protein
MRVPAARRRTWLATILGVIVVLGLSYVILGRVAPRREEGAAPAQEPGPGGGAGGVDEAAPDHGAPATAGEGAASRDAEPSVVAGGPGDGSTAGGGIEAPPEGGAASGTSPGAAAVVSPAPADSAGAALRWPTVVPAGLAAGAPMTAQIGSFRSEAHASEVLREASRLTGLRGVVLAAQVGDARWYRILLGAFATPRQAQDRLDPILRQRMIAEIVLKPIPEGVDLSVSP